MIVQCGVWTNTETKTELYLSITCYTYMTLRNIFPFAKAPVPQARQVNSLLNSPTNLHSLPRQC